MKLIIEHEEGQKEALMPYCEWFEELGNNWAIVEINEEALKWIQHFTTYVELDFALILGQEILGDLSFLSNYPIIFSTIASHKEEGDFNYSLLEGRCSRENHFKKGNLFYWINCFAKEGIIYATDYIKCTKYLIKMAQKLKMPIMIYASLESKEIHYKYRSLTYKIINYYLESYPSLFIMKRRVKEPEYFIPSKKSFEPYINHMVYWNDSIEKVVKEGLIRLAYPYSKISYERFMRRGLRKSSLYDDVFYNLIPLEEKIYVPITSLTYELLNDYTQVGVHLVKVNQLGLMLYGKKQKLDSFSDVLEGQISTNFMCPILSKVPIIRRRIDSQESYIVIPQDSEYRGKDVYIGIVTTAGIDYTHNNLQTKEGKTRISYIWKQIEADQGVYYDSNQINKALQSEDPHSIIPMHDETGEDILLLGIAGGRSGGYEGVASEAEFLVAQINVAPEILQKIYGGIPCADSVLAADLIIGIGKLVELAKLNKKPLVLYIPYSTNIDSHDGTNIYNKYISLLFANQSGCTVVVPTGDEGDKKHHITILDAYTFIENVFLDVPLVEQNLVGYITLRGIENVQIKLYPPNTDKMIINLEEEGIAYYKEVVVYSNGLQRNFDNGDSFILFRLDHLTIGKWRIEIVLSERNSYQAISLWISQQSLNSYITLEPTTSFMTLGSISATKSLIGVGGYDSKDMSVLKSSGRGFTWSGEVSPDFIMQGKEMIGINLDMEWEQIEGTAVSGSLLTGIIANIYSKWEQEKGSPWPNTLVMLNLLGQYVKQYANNKYPNQSQGDGILETCELNSILMTPF